jgi:hypothetical protein
MKSVYPKGSYPLSFKKIVVLSICSFLLVFSLPALAKKKSPKHPPKKPLITEVYVGDTVTLITGTNFDNPDVLLGNGLLLDILTSDDTMIEVSTPAIGDGDYKLIVSQGKNGKDIDEFDLTIGAVGPQGPQGADGAAGPIGLTGAAGTNGTNGTNGVDGAQGPVGLTGPAGAAGAQGSVGPTGPDGENGVQGPAGGNGATGAQGPKGLTGSAGSNGTNGTNGTQGLTGAVGTNGTNGTNGVGGAQGPVGPEGPIGPAGGPAGPAGPAGPIDAAPPSYLVFGSGPQLHFKGDGWVLESNNANNLTVRITEAGAWSLSIVAPDDCGSVNSSNPTRTAQMQIQYRIASSAASETKPADSLSVALCPDDAGSVAFVTVSGSVITGLIEMGPPLLVTSEYQPPVGYFRCWKQHINAIACQRIPL